MRQGDKQLITYEDVDLALGGGVGEATDVSIAFHAQLASSTTNWPCQLQQATGKRVRSDEDIDEHRSYKEGKRSSRIIQRVEIMIEWEGDPKHVKYLRKGDGMQRCKGRETMTKDGVELSRHGESVSGAPS